MERIPQNTNCKHLPPTPTLSSSSSGKSKKLFPNLVKSKHQSAAVTSDSNASHSISNTSSSSSNSSTSSKLARQIFHNLNIFSNKQHQHSNNNNTYSHSDQSQNPSNLMQSKQQSNAIQAKPEPASSLRQNIDNQSYHRRLSNKSNSSTASTQNLIATRHSRRSYRSQDDDLYDGDSSCYSTNENENDLIVFNVTIFLFFFLSIVSN